MSHDRKLVQKRIESLRAEILEGLEQARRGELVSGEKVFERVRKKSRKRRGRNGDVSRSTDE